MSAHVAAYGLRALTANLPDDLTQAAIKSN